MLINANLPLFTDNFQLFEQLYEYRIHWTPKSNSMPIPLCVKPQNDTDFDSWDSVNEENAYVQMFNISFNGIIYTEWERVPPMMLLCLYAVLCDLIQWNKPNA